MYGRSENWCIVVWPSNTAIDIYREILEHNCAENDARSCLNMSDGSATNGVLCVNANLALLHHAIVMQQ